MDNPPNPFMGTPRPGEVDVVGLVGALRMIRGFLFLTHSSGYALILKIFNMFYNVISGIYHMLSQDLSTFSKIFFGRPVDLQQN